jgi:hypothetical protein
MAASSCLTKLDIAMIEISNLTDGCITNLANQADFTGGHTYLGKVTFLSEQLSSTASRTDELAAAPAGNLDVVDQSTDRDVCNRQRIPGADFGRGTGHDCIANLEIERGDNVALLAIRIV